MASAAMETVRERPRRSGTEAGGPAAGAALSWSARMRADTQAQGGWAEMGRTTERRGGGASEGLKEDGGGKKMPK